MSVRIKFSGESVGRQFTRVFGHTSLSIRKAVTRTTEESAVIIKTRGDGQIRAAGKFGARWTRAFHVDVKRRFELSINNRINVFFDESIPYANIHEFGGLIKGKPMLWIPLSFTGIKIRARDYAAAFGGLFRVNRKVGKPLLLSIRDKKPKYFGIKQVSLRPRFGIRRLCREVMAGFNTRYSRNLKAIHLGR